MCFEWRGGDNVNLNRSAPKDKLSVSGRKRHQSQQPFTMLDVQIEHTVHQEEGTAGEVEWELKIETKTKVKVAHCARRYGSHLSRRRAIPFDLIHKDACNSACPIHSRHLRQRLLHR